MGFFRGVRVCGWFEADMGVRVCGCFRRTWGVCLWVFSFQNLWPPSLGLSTDRTYIYREPVCCIYDGFRDTIGCVLGVSSISYELHRSSR